MSYEKLFSRIVSKEVPEGLLEKTINRIQKERKQRAKRRFYIFATSLVMSIIAMVPVASMVKTALAESGFIQFFSLFFSDFRVVMNDWQSFGVILLESLPVASIVYLFIVLFWFLGSTRSLIKNIKTA